MEEIKVVVVKYPDRDNFVLRYVDPITRKQKSKSAKTANRKQAEKLAAVWEDELRSGRYAPSSRTTWDEFRTRYESEVSSGLAARTAEKARVSFDLIEKHLAPAKVRDVTAQRLSWLAAELRKDTKVGDKMKPGISEATLRGYLAHLKAALRWAERVGIIAKAPLFPKPQRAASGDAKGRAITTEEFERMLLTVPKVVGEHAAAEWGRYLRGLWLSGFRVGESLTLSWDEGAGIVVDITGRNPVAHIIASAQKAHRTESLPLATEFGAMLAETPPEARSGFVFAPLDGTGRRASRETAIRTISAIGRKANVKTWTHPRTGKVKCATAHDLRRSFGTRWAALVMPAVLQQMMRHASIQTTMTFYVTRNAVTAGDVIREASERAGLGNNSGNSSHDNASHNEAESRHKSSSSK